MRKTEPLVALKGMVDRAEPARDFRGAILKKLQETGALRVLCLWMGGWGEGGLCGRHGGPRSRTPRVINILHHPDC
jgi:hypothetical protein